MSLIVGALVTVAGAILLGTVQVNGELQTGTFPFHMVVSIIAVYLCFALLILLFRSLWVK